MNTVQQKFQTVATRLSISFFSLLMLCTTAAIASPSSVFAVGLPTTGYCGGITMNSRLLTGSTSDTVIRFISCTLIQSVMPFLFAIASVVFVWGMVKFISTQEAAEREKGKQFMLWGVVALAVMFCMWGLVNILGNTFGVQSVIPQLGQ